MPLTINQMKANNLLYWEGNLHFLPPITESVEISWKFFVSNTFYVNLQYHETHNIFVEVISLE